jgi:hypothetical protein
LGVQKVQLESEQLQQPREQLEILSPTEEMVEMEARVLVQEVHLEVEAAALRDLLWVQEEMEALEH